MPRKIIKSPQALGDIENLYIRGVDLFGEVQAEQFHREIYRRFDLLAENPMLGPARNEIAAGLRLYFLPPPVVIAYRANDDALLVLRVFHGREDYETLLRKE